MVRKRLRLAILTGRGSVATCLSIARLADLPQVQIVGILCESQPQPPNRRVRSVLHHLQREGWTFMPYRLGMFILNCLDRMAARLVSRTEVLELLRQAIPERLSSLADLGSRYQIPIQEVGDFNSARAADALRRLNAELGVVIGTRAMQSSTFSLPRLGCICLDTGHAPGYGGAPPGFWELSDGRSTAPVSVRFLDEDWGTSDVVAEASVLIHPKETQDTLRKKLDERGGELLARCVADLAEGRLARRSQPPANQQPRIPPIRCRRSELEQGHGPASPGAGSWAYALKTLFYLGIFCSGFFHLVRALRKVTGASRACILLYHRINDLVDDRLTTSVERFAEHMLTLHRYYSVISTADLVRKIKSGERLPPNSLAIHFDDCYRDVYAHASRILSRFGFPACAFVASGYVGTHRGFPHDVAMCPFPIENLAVDDLIGLSARGMEIGSHTVNHADLGQCDLATAATEVMQSKVDLERILGRPVPLFSYPFGGTQNMRPEVVGLVQRAGYEAMFSAYGGYVTERSNLFDLPRIGVSNGYRSLDLLMTIEGLSVTALRGWGRGRR